MLKTYMPYAEAYDSPHIKHLIATVSVVKRRQLGRAIKAYLKSTEEFHQLLRKSLGYRFRSIFVIEPHYQEETCTYNIHTHYGVLCHVNLKKIIYYWNMAHGVLPRGFTYEDFMINYSREPEFKKHLYIVKYPTEKGKPVFKSKFKAFLEYATRRRVEQAQTMPLADFYRHILNRQLLRRIGFNKEYLAIVTKIRKEQSEKLGLPDGYFTFWVGNYDITYKPDRIEAHFKRRYTMNPYDEAEMVSFKSHCMRIFKDILDERDIKPEVKQLMIRV